LLALKKSIRIAITIALSVLVAYGIIHLAVFLIMSPNWGYPKVRNTIQIYSDNAFSKHKFPGSGTADDPYLIEDYILGLNESNIRNFYYGLDVSNTTKHFVVQNCVFYGGLNAIRIENVAEGTVIIKDNHFFHITQYEWNNGIGNSGIEIINTDNVIIENNFFQPASKYEQFFYSLTLDEVDTLVFKNNTNDYGHLDIQDSHNILFLGNIFKNSESIRGAENLNFTNNVFCGDISFIQFESCPYTILRNNTFLLSLILWSSSYSEVSFNEIIHQTGIYVFTSDYVDILNNSVIYSGDQVTEHDRGIILQRSRQCRISFNKVYIKRFYQT